MKEEQARPAGSFISRKSAAGYVAIPVDAETYAQHGGEHTLSKPSPFLDDILMDRKSAPRRRAPCAPTPANDRTPPSRGSGAILCFQFAVRKRSWNLLADSEWPHLIVRRYRNAADQASSQSRARILPSKSYSTCVETSRATGAAAMQLWKREPPRSICSSRAGRKEICSHRRSRTEISILEWTSGGIPKRLPGQNTGRRLGAMRSFHTITAGPSPPS